MWKRKPILDRFQLRCYSTLKVALKACDNLNRSRDERKEDLFYIWPREYTDDRKRDFVVEQPSRFWEKYIRMEPKERTFYELIRTNSPCMFYLDIEYSKIFNPDVNSEAMMNRLRIETKKLFSEKLGIDLHSWSPTWHSNADSLNGILIELDASDDNKFSRHLHAIPDSLCLFRNVQHVKEFASNLHDKLWQTNMRVTKLIGNEMVQTTFIDLGVYTNNQNFRLILSSKFAERG